MRIAIASFTPKGQKLQERIISARGDAFVVYDKNSLSLRAFTERQFHACDAMIFIGAIGIVVRLVVPLASSKETDPAVVVMDEKGTFAIPILSGHIGGANDLALELSASIGATPVITTATDLNGKFAVDTWCASHGCAVLDISKIKDISSAILRDESVGFYSDFDVCGDLPKQLKLDNKLPIGICVSLKPSLKPFDVTLNAAPKIITIGTGCKKGTESQAFEAFMLDTLKKNDLSIKSVKALASIDLKKEEPCLLDFSRKYKVDFVTYTSEELSGIKGIFSKSDFVQSVTGTDNVCERSAVLHSKGLLIVPKAAKTGMTAAIAASEWRCAF